MINNKTMFSFKAIAKLKYPNFGPRVKVSNRISKTTQNVTAEGTGQIGSG